MQEKHSKKILGPGYHKLFERSKGFDTMIPDFALMKKKVIG